MISLRDIKFISKAYEYVEDGKIENNYTICAILANKRKILSVGFNHYAKTHPETPQIYSRYTIPIHAEVDAIYQYSKHYSISKSETLYVVGLTRSGKNPVCSSKPCASCVRYIRSKDVRRVVYVENNGYEVIFRELRL